jgi:hypothetical protein
MTAAATLEMPMTDTHRRHATSAIEVTPSEGDITPSNVPAGPAGIDRIVLTGFMGSGKTTAGRLLAQRLGWRLLDLDNEIERREGRSVPQIFAESGEAHFRRAEAAALASVLGRTQQWCISRHPLRCWWSAATARSTRPIGPCSRILSTPGLALRSGGLTMSGSRGTAWRPRRWTPKRPSLPYLPYSRSGSLTGSLVGNVANSTFGLLCIQVRASSHQASGGARCPYNPTALMSHTRTHAFAATSSFASPFCWRSCWRGICGRCWSWCM